MIAYLALLISAAALLPNASAQMHGPCDPELRADYMRLVKYGAGRDLLDRATLDTIADSAIPINPFDQVTQRHDTMALSKGLAQLKAQLSQSDWEILQRDLREWRAEVNQNLGEKEVALEITKLRPKRFELLDKAEGNNFVPSQFLKLKSGASLFATMTRAVPELTVYKDGQPHEIKIQHLHDHPPQLRELPNGHFAIGNLVWLRRAKVSYEIVVVDPVSMTEVKPHLFERFRRWIKPLRIPKLDPPSKVRIADFELQLWKEKPLTITSLKDGYSENVSVPGMVKQFFKFTDESAGEEFAVLIDREGRKLLVVEASASVTSGYKIHRLELPSRASLNFALTKENGRWKIAFTDEGELTVFTIDQSGAVQTEVQNLGENKGVHVSSRTFLERPAFPSEFSHLEWFRDEHGDLFLLQADGLGLRIYDAKNLSVPPSKIGPLKYDPGLNLHFKTRVQNDSTGMPILYLFEKPNVWVFAIRGINEENYGQPQMGPAWTPGQGGPLDPVKAKLIQLLIHDVSEN